MDQIIFSTFLDCAADPDAEPRRFWIASSTLPSATAATQGDFLSVVVLHCQHRAADFIDLRDELVDPRVA
jgi:hypothetical protein